jgi:hypothetical protein
LLGGLGREGGEDLGVVSFGEYVSCGVVQCAR